MNKGVEIDKSVGGLSMKAKSLFCILFASGAIATMASGGYPFSPAKLTDVAVTEPTVAAFGATGSDLITTVAGVYDMLFGMRRCRIKLPNRCYHLISRVAHRAMTKDGKRRIERVAPL